MTALAVPEGLEPLGEWGPYAPGWTHNIDEKIAWVKAHIPDHKDALSATFYLIDGQPVARVRYFARNERGHKYHDPASGRAALELQPVVVPLAELPPARLLKG